MSDHPHDTAHQRSKSNLSRGAVGSLWLILAAVMLGFINEAHAVRIAFNSDPSNLVHTLPAGGVFDVDSPYNGSLVYVSGLASGQGNLTDPDFDVQIRALKLQRTALVYQWREQATVTKSAKSYQYFKTWAEYVEDSKSFDDPSGHSNINPEFETRTVSVPITVNGYALSDALVRRLDDYTALTFAQLRVGAEYKLPKTLEHQGVHFDKKADGPDPGFYVGLSRSHPKIGDTRIVFQAVFPQTVSIVAKLNGRELVPGFDPDGNEVCCIVPGRRPVDVLFHYRPESDAEILWLTRVLVMFLITMAAGPLAAPVSAMLAGRPTLSGLARIGRGPVALLLGVTAATLAFALPWIGANPLPCVCALVADAALIAACAVIGSERNAQPAVR